MTPRGDRLTNSKGAGWSLRDLRRPATLVVSVLALVGAFFATQVVSCGVHEFSHAIVGTAGGWKVDRVVLCPGDARVVYASSTDTWINYAESYAGGLVAAAFVLGVYWLVFARRDRPRRGPVWWAAGIGVLVVAPPQLIIGLLEGMVSTGGRSYSEVLNANPPLWLSVIGASMLAVAALHVWHWRPAGRTTRYGGGPPASSGPP